MSARSTSCQSNEFAMTSLLSSLLVLGLTARAVDGITCYQCTYNDNPYGVGLECIKPSANVTLSVTECRTTCQESVTLLSDNTVYAFSRGCALNVSNNDCCVNQGSMMTCYSQCDDGELCNNAAYNMTSSTDLPSRCPAPEVDGSVPCNSCVYSGGNTNTYCLDSPLGARVGFVQCPTATSECTIKSMRPVAVQTEVWSYERGCHEKGFLPYGITEDSVYITWICHCDTPYCNDNVGDGTTAVCHPTTGGSVDGGGTNSGVSNNRRRSHFFTEAHLAAAVVISFLEHFFA